MRMPDSLARERASVENQPVTIFADAFGDRDTVRLAHHLGEQAFGPARERRDVRVVLLRCDQDMHRGLRVDIAEGKLTVTLTRIRRDVLQSRHMLPYSKSVPPRGHGGQAAR